MTRPIALIPALALAATSACTPPPLEPMPASMGAAGDEALIIPDVKNATNIPFFIAPLLAAGGGTLVGATMSGQRGNSGSTPRTIRP